MSKKLFLLVFVCAATLSHAQNFAGIYTFASVTTSTGLNDPTPPPIATGLTFGSFSAYGTPANPNASGRFSFQNWPNGAIDMNDNYNSLTGIISSGEYYEVTLTPSVGYSIDLSGITFSVQRSSTGIRTYAVRSSLDGFATNLNATINPSNTNLSVQSGNIFFWNFDATTTNQNGSTITLGGPSFTGLTNPVTFRIYGWNSETTLGTFSIDNVTFGGTANAILITSDFTFGPSTICDGVPVQFFDNSQSFNGPITTWSWDFGDPASGPFNTSASQGPTHLFTTCGTYTVSLTVTNSNNNSSTSQQVVNVLCAPAANFTSVNNIGCGPICVNFTDQSTGGATAWSWNFGDNGTSTLQNPSHCYPAPGQYTVSLTVTNANGCSNTITMNNFVTVFPAVIADFTFTTAGLTVNFTNTTSGGTGPYTFTFYPGDGNPPTPFVPASYTYPFDNNWVACLYVTDMNGCMDSTCHTISLLTTGMNTASSNGVNIFPNPSLNGEFTISLNAAAVIRVYDLLGENILVQEVKNAGTAVLDLGTYAAGTYFVKIVSGDRTLTKKISINR